MAATGSTPSSIVSCAQPDLMPGRSTEPAPEPGSWVLPTFDDRLTLILCVDMGGSVAPSARRRKAVGDDQPFVLPLRKCCNQIIECRQDPGSSGRACTWPTTPQVRIPCRRCVYHHRGIFAGGPGSHCQDPGPPAGRIVSDGFSNQLSAIGLRSLAGTAVVDRWGGRELRLAAFCALDPVGNGRQIKPIELPGDGQLFDGGVHHG